MLKPKFQNKAAVGYTFKFNALDMHAFYTFSFCDCSHVPGK